MVMDMSLLTAGAGNTEHYTWNILCYLWTTVEVFQKKLFDLALMNTQSQKRMYQVQKA
jgi:hypothetical protein